MLQVSYLPWVLELKHGSSGRKARALNVQAISPALHLFDTRSLTETRANRLGAASVLQICIAMSDFHMGPGI